MKNTLSPDEIFIIKIKTNSRMKRRRVGRWTRESALSKLLLLIIARIYR